MAIAHATIQYRHVARRNRTIFFHFDSLDDNQEIQSLRHIKVSKSKGDQFALAIFMVDVFTAAN